LPDRHKPLSWYRLSIATDDGSSSIWADQVESDFRLTLG
jgi:hypothetical protein